MLNNISIFSTTNEWQSFSASTDCWKPHVSFTMDNREVRFIPAGKSISQAFITCDNAYYSGSKQVAQNIIVKLYGLTLRNNVDYVVISNSGGTVAGEYPIVVKGINDYINTAKGVFIISKATPVITSSPVAKSNLVYNGSSQTLLSGGAAAIAGSFLYESKTNAGAYSALWVFIPFDTTNYTSKNGYVTATIAKATPTITSSPSAKSNLVYNGNSQPLLSGGTADIEGSFSYDSATNAGTYDASWTFIPTDTTNYNVVTGSVSVTIAKASGSIDTEPVSKSITYNGSSQELVTLGISHTGTMLYKLNNGTWGESIPTASNADTYTIYYKASESDNYTESYSGSVSSTIAKVTPTVTAPVAKTNLVYTGSAQQLATAGSTNFGTIKYSLDNSTYSINIPNGTNATSYTLYYKVDGDSNINSVAAKSITCSIAKADPAYTAPTANNRTYDTTSKALLNAGAVTGGSMQYSSDNTNWSTTIPTGTNANTYTSYWKIIGDSNHNDKSSASISTTIAKASGSVSTAPTAKSLTYNNTDQTLVDTGSGTGTMLYVLSGSTSWSTSIPTGNNAGDYTVCYKASASANYNESASGSVNVTIAKVTPTVTAPTAISLTYNGNPQTLANAGSTDWGTLQYNLNSGTYSTSVPTATNASDYTVYYKVVGNSNINDVAAKTITCSIAKANPTYTAPTKKTGLVYNGSAQNLLNAGSTSHGTIQYSSDNSNWGATIPQGTNASSTYKAYWRLVGDSNHNDVASTEISSISIAKVTPTVTAPTPKTLTFNNSNQVLANAGSTNYGTIQYCLNSSTGTYSTSVPSASAANTTYKVWYKVVGDSNVNDVDPASIDCMIAEKRVTTPTITLDPSSYTYNGTARQPSVTVKDGTTTIPSSEYTVTYSNNTNAGTATVTITDKDAGNYYISGTTTFTISKVTPTVTAPTAKSLTYNGSEQTLANEGSTNWGTLQYSTSETSTYSTTIPKGTNAGSYDVWYKVIGDSNVNSTNPVKVACSIAKSTGTATVNGTTNTYNGSAKNLITVSSNTGTMHYKVDSGGWSTTIPQATNAGSWTIYWYMDESSNYTGIASANTRYVSSSIAKASGSVSTAPTAKSLTYNASAQALVNEGSGTGTMMYKLDSGSWGTGIPSATNATSYTVYYKASASTNYEESASGSVTCSIAKVTPTVTAPVAKSGLVYNGSAQALIDEGSTDWGTLRYSIDGTNYSTIVPSGTNASEYTVYYKVDGDSNINDVSAKYISVTINKTAPLYTAPTKKTGLIYNRGNQDLLNAGSTSDGTFKYSSDNSSWSTSIPQGKNANDNYTVYWKLDGDSDHADVGSTTISGISIAKVTPVLSESPTKASDWTYDGNSHTLASGGSMKHSSTDSTVVDGIFSYGSATNAGSYTATWSFTPTDTTNYNGDNGNVGTVTVSKANVSYSAPNYSDSTYDGNSHYIMTTGTIYSPSSAYFQYSANGSSGWSTTRPTAVDAGQYYPYYRIIANNSNYNDVGATRIATRTDIYKADQSAPTAYGASVGCGSSASATASGGGGQGSLEWSNGSSRTDLGSQDTQARWTGNSNYNASSWSNVVTLTVSMNNQSAPTAYGSTTTYPTTATATASGGGGVGSLEWESEQSQTSVGSHSTRARWSGNSCYNASPWSNYVTVQMNKADQSAPTAYGSTTTYPTTATASASGGGGVGSLEWENGQSQTSVGVRTTRARWTGNGNYNASPWSNYATVQMNKASRTLSWTRSASTLSVNMRAGILAEPSDGSGDGSVTYKSSNTSIATIGRSTVIGDYVEGVGDGTCTITATISEGNNYLSASTSFTLTVNSPKAIIVVNTPGGKRNPQVIFYNTSNQSEYTLGSYVGGGTFEVAWGYGGTVNKLTWSNNTSNIPYLTVIGDGGTILLDRASLTGSYGNITLTTSFDAGNYQTYGKTLTLNFTDV